MDFLQSLLETLAVAIRRLWPGVLGAAAFGYFGWSIAGFLLGWAVQAAIGMFAYRLTRVRQMARQYPWLYRRKGLLGWEERH